jgi:hypothetical protein
VDELVLDDEEEEEDKTMQIEQWNAGSHGAWRIEGRALCMLLVLHDGKTQNLFIYVVIYLLFFHLFMPYSLLLAQNSLDAVVLFLHIYM